MTKIALDAIDRKILQFLIRNARMPYLEIARECGISGAAIHQRVKKLDELGVIQGSRLEVDPITLGFDVCAFIWVRVTEPSKHNSTVLAFKEIPEVVECHFITGEYNMMVKVYCTDNKHLMETIFNRVLPIDGVQKTETFISLLQSFSRQIDIKHLQG